MRQYTQSFLKDPDSQDLASCPPEYFTYDLKGVVIHLGTADSGHYYSLIKDSSRKPEEWLEFNDTIIKKFDPNDLSFEAFGGEDKSLSEYSQAFREKSHNAYLLFYERTRFFDEFGREKPAFESFGNENLQSSESLDFIKADNLRFYINKILLDRCFETFFWELGCDLAQKINDFQEICKENSQNCRENANNYQESSNYQENINNSLENGTNYQENAGNYQETKENYLENPQETAKIVKNLQETKEIPLFSANFLALCKLFLLNTILVIIRSKDRERLPKHVRICKQMLRNCEDLALWFLEQSSFAEILREFLVECCVEDMKYVFLGLLKASFQKILVSCEESAVSARNREEIANFLQVCLNFLENCEGSADFLLRTLLFLAKSSEFCRKTLISRGFLRIFEEFVKETPKPATNLQVSCEFSVKCELKPLNFCENPSKKLENREKKPSSERISKEFAYFSAISAELLRNIRDFSAETARFQQFLCEKAFLRRILLKSRRKHGVRAAARLVCETNLSSEEFLQFLFEELGTAEDSDARIYWICCEEMLKNANFSQKETVF